MVGLIEQQNVQAKVNECLAKVLVRFGVDIPKPIIRYKLRGRVAGRAYYYQHLIDLNAVLLKENGQKFIDRTVVHEVAHLIAYKLYGSNIRPHGREWANLMVMLGAQPSRCHSYDVTNALIGKSYSYSCGCRKHALTGIRHKRSREGSRYTCTKCRKVLVWDQGSPSVAT